MFGFRDGDGEWWADAQHLAGECPQQMNPDIVVTEITGFDNLGSDFGSGPFS